MMQRMLLDWHLLRDCAALVTAVVILNFWISRCLHGYSTNFLNSRPEWRSTQIIRSGARGLPPSTSVHTPPNLYRIYMFHGVFQFTRLPFGPCRAPSYFQEQMVTMVLYGLIYHCCEMYLDDCIVYGRGEAEFLKNLRSVFKDFALKILSSKQRNADSVSNVLNTWAES